MREREIIDERESATVSAKEGANDNESENTEARDSERERESICVCVCMRAYVRLA